MDALADAAGRLAGDAGVGCVERTRRGDAAGTIRDTADAASRPYLIRIGRQAMACQFEVLLNAGQYAAGGTSAREALDLVDQLEEQLSVYRDSSEVSRLNRLAAERPVPVEAGLFGLLRQSQILWRETDGAFDITAGPLSKAWGFFHRQGRVPDEAELQAALVRVGMRHAELDEANRSVKFALPGMEINLGAIGKGYALDRAGDVLRDAGIADFLLHGGRSSVLAAGSNAASAEQDGWVVSLEDPLRPGRALAEFRLRDAALGTSGTATQFFRHRGRRYGHILDPRSGRPVEGMFAATVVASTAAEADALATAFYVLGRERAEEYCARHPGIAALLVLAARQGDAVEVAAFGFAEGVMRLE